MAEFTLPNAEQFDELLDIMKRNNGETPPDDLTGAPGPKHLLYGNRDCGFYGFVQPNEFGKINSLSGDNNQFNGANIALAIGMPHGELVYNHTSFMKFSWKGKIQFIPTKPIRKRVSWEQVYRAGAVYGTGEILSAAEENMLRTDVRFGMAARVPQRAAVTANGITYKVRLIRGAASDPQNSQYDDDRGSKGPDNEWNRLILPLHVRAPENFYYNLLAGAPTEKWGINLTDNDLITHYSMGDACYTICQEMSDEIAENDPETTPIRRVRRGSYGAESLNTVASLATSDLLGWRPVLELA